MINLKKRKIACLRAGKLIVNSRLIPKPKKYRKKNPSKMKGFSIKYFKFYGFCTFTLIVTLPEVPAVKAVTFIKPFLPFELTN